LATALVAARRPARFSSSPECKCPLEGYVKHVARGKLWVGQKRRGLLTECGDVPQKAYCKEGSASGAHMLRALFSHFGAKRNFARPGSVTYTARSK
jgi:hypothetical protein